MPPLIEAIINKLNSPDRPALDGQCFLLIFGLIGCILALMIYRRLKLKRSPFYPLCAKPIMTPNEQEFFARLSNALPHYHVFPQVAFNTLLDVDKSLRWHDRLRIRNHFDRKIADYVLCQKDDFKVIAIVELDDRTHKAEKDKKRDALLASAGYRVVRFQSQKKPCETEITALFTDSF